MAQWFLTKYRYQQAIDEANVGTRNEEFIKTKVVTCQQLIDAVSYGDAETKTFALAAANGNTSVEIIQDVRFSLSDVFHYDDGEDWYLGKVDFIIEDEKTGKQKRSPSRMLLNASSHKQASERLEQQLKSSLDPFEIMDVAKTRIQEVVEHVA